MSRWGRAWAEFGPSSLVANSSAKCEVPLVLDADGLNAFAHVRGPQAVMPGR